MDEYSVYIMSSGRRTIYIGVTNDLQRRVFEHKKKLISGFTSKYNYIYLVYFEMHNDIIHAIAREKELKGWVRKKKIALIEQSNPDWKDLASEWY